MSDGQRLAALRELFLSAPIPTSTLVVALLTGLLQLAIVLWLVRRRSLREEYTPIWLLAAVAVTVISVWQQPISAMTRAIGAWSHTSTLFFCSLVFLVAVSLNYAVRLSRLSLQLKNLGQELALLRAEVEERR